MDINSFKAHFKYGGARTSLFRVVLTNPISGTADAEIPFLARASALPTSAITPIEVSYQGRTIKVAGKKTFEDWNVTIYNDEDFRVRNDLETWANMINSPEGNIRKGGSSDANLYKSIGQVEQLSQTGLVLRTYRFVGIFPTVIAGIDLDWDGDNVQSFQVQFSYDYYEVLPGRTGDAGGA